MSIGSKLDGFDESRLRKEEEEWRNGEEGKVPDTQSQGREGLPYLTEYIEQLGVPKTFEEAVRERDFWVEEAARFSRGEEYYTVLLDEIAEVLGPDAFTADDGSLSDSPIRAKLPELVRRRIAALTPLPDTEGWQPIETAPFTYDGDGKRWLHRCLMGAQRDWSWESWVGQLDAGEWLVCYGDGSCSGIRLEDAPTHWRPLPVPPSIDGIAPMKEEGE